MSGLIELQLTLTITGELDAVEEIRDLLAALTVRNQLLDDVAATVEGIFTSADVGSNFEIKATLPVLSQDET